MCARGLRVSVRVGWGRIELREGCAVDGVDVGIYTDTHSLHASHGVARPVDSIESETDSDSRAHYTSSQSTFCR